MFSRISGRIGNSSDVSIFKITGKDTKDGQVMCVAEEYYGGFFLMNICLCVNIVCTIWIQQTTTWSLPGKLIEFNFGGGGVSFFQTISMIPAPDAGINKIGLMMEALLSQFDWLCHYYWNEHFSKPKQL